MAKIPPVRQTFYYDVPRARVFSALTKPRELSKWFASRARVDLRKGGIYHLSWPGGFSMKGTVRVVRAPSRLTVAWVDELAPGKKFETTAHFVLRPKGRGTVLQVTHEDFGKGKQWVRLFGAIQSGWAHYLTNLRAVLEHQTDLRSPHDMISGG